MFVVYKPCSSWYVHYVCVLCLVAQSCPPLCDPMDCSLPGSSVHGNSPGKKTGVGCHALLQENLPTPGIEPRSPTFQADSLLSKPPGKPMNTGVHRLIFKVVEMGSILSVYIQHSENIQSKRVCQKSL